MITKESHFIADIYLSQVGDNASSMVNSNDKLNSFIAKCEPEILIKGLGRKLYNELDSNLEVDGSVKVSADSKWSELLSGTEYIKNGVTFYWKGLITPTECLTAYYVYHQFVIDDISQQTTLGSIKAEAKNASSASAIPKTVDAWRKLYKWYMGANSYIPDVYHYRGVSVVDYCSGDKSKEVSLHQFLSDNKEVYNDWYFTPIEQKNTWVI